MTKSVKNLAGAALFLIISAQIASAGDEGTCAEYSPEEIAGSEAAPSTPVPTATGDYTRIAQSAPATENTAAVLTSPAGDAEKKQTDSLPKEHQSSVASVPSVFDVNSDY